MGNRRILGNVSCWKYLTPSQCQKEHFHMDWKTCIEVYLNKTKSNKNAIN